MLLLTERSKNSFPFETIFVSGFNSCQALSPLCGVLSLTLLTIMEFNAPYESTDKHPQEIRNDFLSLTETCDANYLFKAVASQFNTDQLAEFIDDFSMGRI